MPYRYRHKGKTPHRDANEPDIIRELQDRGAVVIQLDTPVDLVVGYRGTWTLVEIKNGPKAPFKPGQIEFLEDCRRRGLPVAIVDDLDDVDTLWPIPPDSAGVRRPLTARKLDSIA